ncbi:MAG: toll/interleukin-1 receptor domain-containing protein [Anaerolineae bacterium]|nr:toll/interleukin-1 receptor domain-containing protein [Anaerolineae bacterium]
MASIPRVFISYSWDDDAHKVWVRDLATRLRGDGVDVTLDQWHAVPGDQLPTFMETAVRESDFVLIVCTPNFQRKTNTRHGGVGYEGDIMTAEVFILHNQRKFLPILRSGDWDTASPSWLKGKYYIDLRGQPYAEANYQDLLTTLHDARPTPPPIGPRPDFTPSAAAVSAPAQRPLVSVAGLAAILDEISDLVASLEYVGHTFGEMRRILVGISRLHRLIEGAILRNQGSLADETVEAVKDYAATIKHFISEADYTLPYPSEDKYTRDRERLKDLKSRVIYGWSGLKPALLADAATAVEFDEIKTADRLVWNELGFTDRNGFWRFVSPHTEEMLASAGEIELTLLEDILQRETFSEASILAEGYPKEILVEVGNALMGDKYVQTEDFETFTVTPIGKHIVSRLVAKRRGGE